VEQLPGLPEAAFDKADPSPDGEFYAYPRFVTHIDDAAIATVTQSYRESLPSGGAVLDLMSSWVSHLPEDVAYASVVGHGMNEEELAANRRLSRWFVQDLNIEPALPLGDGVFDGACLCVSVQYVVSFSNRCFPTKAVAIWQAIPGPDQQRLVGAYMRAAGFTNIADHASMPREGDPLWIVIGVA
jgi:hypothetical protein